ncbi:MAG: hypothetical protein DMF81_11980 [Acidobacteria bacterium]|nr:MAG: hypothetical protein DMF81_11980 [Acidobacteriota bacterium]
MAIAEDLDQLETMLRQLQIEWEKFFGRVEKKPPNDLKARVEALIRRYAYAEMRNNNERFRYQSLAARYSTFSELWNKRLRALEEGRPVGVHGHVPPPAAASGAPPAAPARAAGSAGRGEFRVRSPEKDESAVRALYERFLEARQQAGEKGTVKFDSFQKLISQQASRIMADKGAQAVDFRLETKEGKVSLKAKVVKQG